MNLATNLDWLNDLYFSILPVLLALLQLDKNALLASNSLFCFRTRAKPLRAPWSPLHSVPDSTKKGHHGRHPTIDSISSFAPTFRASVYPDEVALPPREAAAWDEGGKTPNYPYSEKDFSAPHPIRHRFPLEYFVPPPPPNVPPSVIARTSSKTIEFLPVARRANFAEPWDLLRSQRTAHRGSPPLPFRPPSSLPPMPNHYGSTSLHPPPTRTRSTRPRSLLRQSTAPPLMGAVVHPERIMESHSVAQRGSRRWEERPISFAASSSIYSDEDSIAGGGGGRIELLRRVEGGRGRESQATSTNESGSFGSQAARESTLSSFPLPPPAHTGTPRTGLPSHPAALKY